METFGVILKRIRNAHKLSLRQLAMKYGRLQGHEDGVSTSAIAGLESGYRNPSQTVISLLCEAMGCTDGERNELQVAAGLLPTYKHDLTIDGMTVSVYSISQQVTDQELQEVTATIKQVLENRPPQ